MKDQAWFELKDIRNRDFAQMSWVPLRMEKRKKAGILGLPGYCDEYAGIATTAIPVSKKPDLTTPTWCGIEPHRVWIRDGKYVEADRYKYSGGKVGIPLVLDQDFEGCDIKNVWHLHQDLVIALGLCREEDVWVRPEEGYIDVVRLNRYQDGRPFCIQIRAEFLLDYLSARKMGLGIKYFHERREQVLTAGHITWPSPHCESSDGERWKGSVFPYHGPTEPGIAAGSVLWIRGECWQHRWIGPGRHSPRIRGDQVPGQVDFITDVSGAKKRKDSLSASNKWLFFKPEVISSILATRGTRLAWLSKETGCSGFASDGCVHFGVNSIGLINVFAKDITELPDWQQRRWVGYNVTPEGGISEELFASQMLCCPAHTVAPETRLVKALESLGSGFFQRFGKQLFREHADFDRILASISRFRVTDERTLLALAKDVARITADLLWQDHLQEIARPPDGKKLRTLKSLECVLATIVPAEEAGELLAPLFGIYDLRHADAHLPSSDLSDAYSRIGIDSTQPFVFQGMRLIENCAHSLERAAQVLLAEEGVGESSSPAQEETKGKHIQNNDNKSGKGEEP